VHRDIKGANILTTKDGYFIIIIYYIKYRVVKLADFGVATRLTDDEKSFSLVGTYFNYLYFNIKTLLDGTRNYRNARAYINFL